MRCGWWMLSVLHELSRIREGGREYVSPMSEEEEKERRRRKYTPEQARQINFASCICIDCFLFLFPSSLFRLRKGIRK